MAQEFKQINVPEQDHEEGAKLASDWKSAGLGTLTHGDIYRAGLQVQKARFTSLAPASQKAE
jgi:hypothetical protein